MVPSTPLYSSLNNIKSISEVDNRTISISFLDSDRFAVDAIANVFALPANLLPTTNGPLGLMLAGALESSGAFTLVKFVQGSGVVLQSGQLGGVVYAVEGQGLFGSRIGGSQAKVLSQALIYEGESLGNATFTVQIYDGSGNSEGEIEGSYLGLGLYGAILNLNDQPLPVGEHSVRTQLYAQLPSGAVILFGEQSLNVNSPQLLLQMVVYVVALIAVGVVLYNASLRKAKPPTMRRASRRRRPRARKLRRRR
jgi:hypothetical protein